MLIFDRMWKCWHVSTDRYMLPYWLDLYLQDGFRVPILSLCQVTVILLWCCFIRHDMTLYVMIDPNGTWGSYYLFTSVRCVRMNLERIFLGMISMPKSSNFYKLMLNACLDRKMVSYPLWLKIITNERYCITIRCRSAMIWLLEQRHWMTFICLKDENIKRTLDLDRKIYFGLMKNACLVGKISSYPSRLDNGVNARNRLTVGCSMYKL